MASIFDISSSSQVDYSSLFGAASTSSSSGTDSSLLTDWASIKNGTYGKLTKAYYGKQDTKASSTESEDKIKETIKANSSIKSDSSSLRTAASALSKDSLYEKVEKKDADGNVTSDYDRDKIYKNLKSFADAYNSVIKSSVDSDNNRVLRNALSMTKNAKANANLLSDIGITINEDNTLSVDESKVKEANISDIKSLFKGAGSFADQIDSRASEIINQINYENNKLSNYTSAGAYDAAYIVGSNYDGNF